MVSAITLLGCDLKVYPQRWPLFSPYLNSPPGVCSFSMRCQGIVVMNESIRRGSTGVRELGRGPLWKFSEDHHT